MKKKNRLQIVQKTILCSHTPLKIWSSSVFFVCLSLSLCVEFKEKDDEKKRSTFSLTWWKQMLVLFHFISIHNSLFVRASVCVCASPCTVVVCLFSSFLVVGEQGYAQFEFAVCLSFICWMSVLAVGCAHSAPVVQFYAVSHSFQRTHTHTVDVWSCVCACVREREREISVQCRCEPILISLDWNLCIFCT